MAILSNGTTISFGGTSAAATDIRITPAVTAIETTTLNAAVTSAIASRPTITGSATIHCDIAPGTSLAQKFGGATPDGTAIAVVINAAGGVTGGQDFSGSAIITGFNVTYSNDQVMSAEVSWQYTGQITITQAA